jgi:uncharacterized protein
VSGLPGGAQRRRTRCGSCFIEAFEELTVRKLKSRASGVDVESRTTSLLFILEPKEPLLRQSRAWLPSCCSTAVATSATRALRCYRASRRSTRRRRAQGLGKRVSGPVRGYLPAMGAVSGALGAVAGVTEAALVPLGLVVDELPRQRGGLRATGHRPWPLPGRPWLMGQTWYDLLFAHWAVGPELLQPLVPPPLGLDVRDGRAWLGGHLLPGRGATVAGHAAAAVAVELPRVERAHLRRFRRASRHLLFSLDAARVVAVVAARLAYRLPYFHAEMTVDRQNSRVSYESRRVDSSGPPAEFRARYGPSCRRLAIEDGSLERWLAERYCVYVVDERGRALRGEIHHPPWPLQPAEATFEANTMAAPLGIELDSRPLLHFSARQDVVIWPLAA